MAKEISVVIPAYNEAERIKPTIKAIDNYLMERFANYEIIVVDDGSQDGTFSVLTEMDKRYKNLKVIRNEANSGKGGAVKKGILFSKGSLILISDADLSTPIEELEKLQTWIRKGFDIAIGSRGLPGAEILVRQPWYREYMGKIFNILVRILVLGGIRDTQCGFKIFRGDVARDIFKRSKIAGFSFDVEALYIAKRLHYKVREVPIRWMNSHDSKLSILKDPSRMINELFRIKRIHG